MSQLLLRLRLSVELSRAMASLEQAMGTMAEMRDEGGVEVARELDGPARAISNASQALEAAWQELS